MTDNTALTEQIARALHAHWVCEPNGGTARESWTSCTCGLTIIVPGGTRDEAWRRGDAHQAEQIAAVVLPIIRAEKTRVWDEAYGLGVADAHTSMDWTDGMVMPGRVNPHRHYPWKIGETDD